MSASKKAYYDGWRSIKKTFAIHQALDLDALDRLLAAVAEEQGVSINDVCVAGGYLRDAANARQPKDIDVFVKWNADVHDVFTRAEGYEWCDVTEQSTLDMEFMGEKWPVNIIVLDLADELGQEVDEPWVLRVMRRFDFNICQIGYSVPTSVVCTPAYENGVRAKKIEFNPTIASYREVNSFSVRLPRLLEKYVGWSAPVKAE